MEKEMRIRILRTAAERERQSNDSLEQKMGGTPVSYGMAVQLRHVQSGQFVAVQPRKLATLEKHCSAVTLVPQGRKNCWFAIVPRYRLRQEGERVVADDQVIFRSLTADLLLHVSSATYDEGCGSRRELNCSPSLSSGLRISTYESYRGSSKSQLLSGSVVRLRHTETEGQLSVYTRYHRMGLKGQLRAEREQHRLLREERRFQRSKELQEAQARKQKKETKRARREARQQRLEEEGSDDEGHSSTSSSSSTSTSPRLAPLHVGSAYSSSSTSSADSGYSTDSDSDEAEMARQAAILAIKSRGSSLPVPEPLQGQLARGDSLPARPGTQDPTASLHSSLPVLLRIADDAMETESSNNLWEIENEHRVRGGPIPWLPAAVSVDGGSARAISQSIRLRHVGTGLYLAAVPRLHEEGDMEDDSIDESETELNTAQLLLVSPEDLQESMRLYSLFVMESTKVELGTNVDQDACIRLRSEQTGLIVHIDHGDASTALFKPTKHFSLFSPRTPMPGTAGFTPAGSSSQEEPLQAGTDGADAFDSVRFRSSRLSYNREPAARWREVQLLPSSEGTDTRAAAEDALQLCVAEYSLVRNVMVVISARPKLESLLQRIIEAGKSGQEVPAQVWQMAEEVLSRLIFFLVKTTSSNPFTCEGIPIRAHQRLCREQRLLDVAVDILRAPFDSGVGLYQLNELDQRSAVVRVLQLCYRLLKHSATDYRQNELYLAVHIPFFIKQACATSSNNDLFAESTLTSLLTDNKTLLSEAISEKTITLFVNLMNQQDVDDRYIRILIALCTCQGEPIPSNQEGITEILLSQPEYKDLLVSFRVNDSPSLPEGASWEERSKKLPWWVMAHTGSLSGIEVKAPGSKVWEPIEIMALLPEEVNEEKEEDGDPHTRMESLRALRRYCLASFDLYSFVCRGRNYRGIYEVEKLCPYPVVLRAMRCDTLPDDFRAAFTWIMLRVYVDRDPQELLILPQLTRVWRDVDQAVGLPAPAGWTDRDMEEMKRSASSRSSLGSQGLAQTELSSATLPPPRILGADLMSFIDDFLNSQSGSQKAFERRKNSLMFAVLRLCRMLVECGFYNTPQVIKKLVNIIVKLMNGATDVMTEDEIPALAPEFSRDRPVEELPNHPTARYEMTEETLPIMQAKLQMCRILLIISRLRLNVRLSSFFQKFKPSLRRAALELQSEAQPLHSSRDKRAGNWREGHLHDVELEAFNSIFDDSEEDDLDLQVLSQGDLVAILLDLTLYKYQPLVNAAFELLVEHFSERRQLLDGVSQVQLLINDEAVEVYNTILTEITSLRSLTEDCEMWYKPTPEWETVRKSYPMEEAPHRTYVQCQLSNTGSSSPVKRSHSPVPFESDDVHLEIDGFLMASELPPVSKLPGLRLRDSALDLSQPVELQVLLPENIPLQGVEMLRILNRLAALCFRCPSSSAVEASASHSVFSQGTNVTPAALKPLARWAEALGICPPSFRDPHPETQRSMRNLAVHKVLLELLVVAGSLSDAAPGDEAYAGRHQLLSSGYHLLTEAASHAAAAADSMRHDHSKRQGPATPKGKGPSQYWTRTSMARVILFACHRCLQAFCRNNPDNQEEMFSKIPFLIDQLGLEVGAEITITEILRDNLTLCRRMTEDMTRAISTKLATVGYRPSFLAPLIAFMAPRGQFLRRNQDLVMKVIMDPGSNAALPV